MHLHQLEPCAVHQACKIRAASKLVLDHFARKRFSAIFLEQLKLMKQQEASLLGFVVQQFF